MTQNLLHCPQRGAHGHVMGGESVSDRVDAGILDSRLGHILLHHMLDGPRSKRLAELGDEQSVVLHIGSDIQPALEPTTRLIVERNPPILEPIS